MSKSNGTGQIRHCINRGVLGIDIFNNKSDRWRFLQILRYKNHAGRIRRWSQTVKPIAKKAKMPWPNEWPEQDRLVNIAGYILMDNHYHLILQELAEDGIPRFMQKLSNSYIAYLQTKYDRDERLFKGRYQSVQVSSDNQLRKLFVYVLIKNAFELNEGLPRSIRKFDKAYKNARQYNFSALAGLIGNRENDIVTTELFSQFFTNSSEFKIFAKQQMNRYQAFLANIDKLTLE